MKEQKMFLIPTHIFILSLMFYTTEQLRASFGEFANTGFSNSTIFLIEKDGSDIATSTVMDCGALCMYTETCIGFFFKENEFCKLVPSLETGNLISATGSAYFQLQDSCTLRHNPCNAGQCTPGQYDHLYTCQCPSGITGEHCTEGEYYIDLPSNDAQYSYGNDSRCYTAEVEGTLLYYKDYVRNTLAYRIKLNGVSNFNQVQSAKMSFKISNVGSGSFSYDIKIKAMKRVNSTTDLEQCTDFIYDNLRTTAEVIWSGPHSSPQVGEVLETPDISPLLNEVIGMDGWQPGNHVDIVFFNDDLPNYNDGEIGYYVHPGSADKSTAPKMVVSFK